MTERTFGEKVVDGTIAVLLLALGLNVGCTFRGVRANQYHASWCHERLAHAPTPSDSLVVYQDDDFCLKVEE